MHGDHAVSRAADDRLVETALRGLGLDADQPLRERLLRLAEELATWGPRLGLSNIGSANEALVKHVLDSLLLTRVVQVPDVLVDVGTGSGVPALPLAAVWPTVQVIAVDSRRKSNWLVTKLAEELGLRNVSHQRQRAESASLRALLGDKADVVCCRGLAQPERALELCEPLARPGGVVAVLGGDDLPDSALGQAHPVHTLQLPGADWKRSILLCTRTA